tara:strand:+ start:4765 stop:4998 length:234 start_codon:yes stop_codon:yes gene_type:complete
VAQRRNEIPSLLNENALSGMVAYAGNVRGLVEGGCRVLFAEAADFRASVPSRRAPVVEAFVTQRTPPVADSLHLSIS